MFDYDAYIVVFKDGKFQGIYTAGIGPMTDSSKIRWIITQAGGTCNWYTPDPEISGYVFECNDSDAVDRIISSMRRIEREVK
jgi:hypothetical protein